MLHQVLLKTKAKRITNVVAGEEEIGMGRMIVVNIPSSMSETMTTRQRAG